MFTFPFYLGDKIIFQHNSAIFSVDDDHFFGGSIIHRCNHLSTPKLKHKVYYERPQFLKHCSDMPVVFLSWRFFF